MALDDVNRQLYEQKKTSRNEREFSDSYDVEQANGVYGEKKEKDIAGRTSAVSVASWLKNRKRALIVGATGIAAILMVLSAAFGIVRYRQGLFQDENVKVDIQGPDTVATNERVQFSITYENANKVALSGATLEITYPEVFVPDDKDGLKRTGLTGAAMDLGDIKPGEKKTVDIYGSFSGSQQKTVFINAALVYSPAHLSGSFRREAQKGVALEGSIADVKLVTPLEAASGDAVDLLISYTNNSRQPLYGARIQMTYPDSFFFQGADRPSSEGESVWYIDVVGVGETQSFHIRGHLNGENDTVKTFRAAIGTTGEDNAFSVFSQSQSETRVIGSPFIIAQTIESGDVVRAGQTMRYIITYENNGDLGLRDAIITAKLGGDVFYEPQLSLKNGSYDANTRTITWRAADVPELATVDPGEVGSVEFSVPAKTEIPVESEQDKNFVGSTTVTIDSKDIPDRIGAERIIAKNYEEVRLEAGTTSTFSIRDAKTNTPLNDIVFEVGKEVLLNVTWHIRNVYNDLADTNAIVSLPADVTWAETTSEEGENVSFNERAQQVVWDLGALKNGTGTFLPERSISFAVRVVPQEYQKNGQIRFLQDMRVVGRDVFTQTSVIKENGEISCVEGQSHQCKGQYSFD